MKYAVIIRDAAKSDLREACAWYDEKQPGLSDELIECIDRTLEKLRQWPGLGIIVHKILRRAPVPRFPYGVFYVFDGQQISVVGIIHARRSPRYWKGRLP